MGAGVWNTLPGWTLTHGNWGTRGCEDLFDGKFLPEKRNRCRSCATYPFSPGRIDGEPAPSRGGPTPPPSQRGKGYARNGLPGDNLRNFELATSRRPVTRQTGAPRAQWHRGLRGIPWTIDGPCGFPLGYPAAYPAADLRVSATTPWATRGRAFGGTTGVTKRTANGSLTNSRRQNGKSGEIRR